jgi:hypothetical protein
MTLLHNKLGNPSSITTFCLDLVNVPWNKEESSSHITNWMMQFTNLKHLKLAFMDDMCNTFTFLVFCQRTHWPSLVELSFEGVFDVFTEFGGLGEDTEGDHVYNAGENKFATFLHNHPTLERLRICTEDNYSGFVQPQTVSRLCSLILGDSDFCEPLGDWFPLNIAQQIEYLECRISEKFLPILRAMSSLQVLNAIHMDVETFQLFVEAVPHIQQLSIPYGRWYRKQSASLGAVCPLLAIKLM